MARTSLLQWGITVTKVSAARGVCVEFHLYLVISTVTLQYLRVFELVVVFLSMLALTSVPLKDTGTS